MSYWRFVDQDEDTSPQTVKQTGDGKQCPERCDSTVFRQMFPNEEPRDASGDAAENAAPTAGPPAQSLWDDTGQGVVESDVPNAGRSGVGNHNREENRQQQDRACTDRKSTRLNSSHGYISYAV